VERSKVTNTGIQLEKLTTEIYVILVS
jgi:hypothetical protein